MSRLPVSTMGEASVVNPHDYLFGLTLHGIKLGFHNIDRLLDAAANPQHDFPVVHIGGTNGKGSVVALLKGMLRASGYRTGCFTSPHLIDVSERFQVDGVCISELELENCIEFFRKVAERDNLSPTFFEMNTAIAFQWFKDIAVELALIEVGMGGRLDSTNVVSPVATVITNIDLEHTKYLGDTVEEIAYEKAGILKAGVPVVIGETRAGPLEVILDRAAELGCPTFVLDCDFSYTLCGAGHPHAFSYESPTLALRSVPLGLAGSYQGANAAVAVAVAERLCDRFAALDDTKISAGLSEAAWPCRLEWITLRGGSTAKNTGCLDRDVTVVIDVAHNTAGARKLAGELRRCVTILAVASDKDARGMLNELAAISEPLILTTFGGDRGLPLGALRDAAAHHPYRTAASLREAIEMGLSQAGDDRPLLITGSNFTAGEARKILIAEYGAPALRF